MAIALHPHIWRAAPHAPGNGLKRLASRKRGVERGYWIGTEESKIVIRER
jgi:hypothetical protein